MAPHPLPTPNSPAESRVLTPLPWLPRLLLTPTTLPWAPPGIFLLLQAPMPKSQVPQILALLPSHSIIPCHRGNTEISVAILSLEWEKVVQLNLEFVDIHGWWYMGVFVRDRCVWYQCIPNSGWILRKAFFSGHFEWFPRNKRPILGQMLKFSHQKKRSDVTVCDSFILWLSFSPPAPCTLAKTLVYLFPVFWPVFLVFVSNRSGSQENQK